MRRSLRALVCGIATVSSLQIPVATGKLARASTATSLSRMRGGAAMLSTVVEPPPPAVEKFRLDYAPPPYRIDSLTLDFDIHEEETIVTSTLTVHPSAGAAGPFELDGEDLSLRSIELDGALLTEGTDYELTSEGLSVLKPPADATSFQLKTVVAIEPHKNTQLSGLCARSCSCNPAFACNRTLTVAIPVYQRTCGPACCTQIDRRACM